MKKKISIFLSCILLFVFCFPVCAQPVGTETAEFFTEQEIGSVETITSESAFTDEESDSFETDTLKATSSEANEPRSNSAGTIKVLRARTDDTRFRAELSGIPVTSEEAAFLYVQIDDPYSGIGWVWIPLEDCEIRNGVILYAAARTEVMFPFEKNVEYTVRAGLMDRDNFPVSDILAQTDFLPEEGGGGLPDIEAVPEKRFVTLPESQKLTVLVDGEPAAPEDVVWYQLDGNGEIIEETVHEYVNPLTFPATVPMDAPSWFASVRVDGMWYADNLFEKPWTNEFPEGMAVVFNNQPVFPGESYEGAEGTVELSADGKQLLVRDIQLGAFEPGTGITAELLAFGYDPDSYEILFEGDCDFGYFERPEAPEKYYSILGIFGGGSNVTIRGEEASVKARGINFQEIRTIDYMDKITAFRFEDLKLKSHTYTYESMLIHGTQTYFTDCDMDFEVEDLPGALVIGINNFDHEEEEEITEWRNSSLRSVNHFAEPLDEEAPLGALNPSAYNDIHEVILFENCETELLLDHMTQGECRGVYSLSAALTIDGGSFCSRVVCQPEDISDQVRLGTALQAVDVTIRNGAQVDLYANAPKDSWGIIYANNVLVDESKLDILVEDGINAQGIYFFGSSRKPDVGTVSIRNSQVTVDVTGNSDEYAVEGISGRAFLSENSDVLVHVKDRNEQYPAAFLIYDFRDTGKILLTKQSMKTPEGGIIRKISDAPFTRDTFYTVTDGQSGEIAAEVHLIPKAEPTPKHGGSGTPEAKPAFTGTYGNPVSDGTWTLEADGSWSYRTNAYFKNTWGYIANPYAGGKADWFWFDENGRMLFGWQKIGGRWYYLNPSHDGTLGACLTGPAVTPDGYTVDETGAWTVDGIVQE